MGALISLMVSADVKHQKKKGEGYSARECCMHYRNVVVLSSSGLFDSLKFNFRILTSSSFLAMSLQSFSQVLNHDD